MKNRLKYLFAMLSILTYLLTSCSTEESGPNKLTAQEKEDGWQLLFDGTSLKGWHLYNRGEAPSAWIAQNGELYCQPIFDTTAHGDLVSDQVFKNYELAFEWKISEGATAGFSSMCWSGKTFQRPGLPALNTNCWIKPTRTTR